MLTNNIKNLVQGNGGNSRRIPARGSGEMENDDAARQRTPLTIKVILAMYIVVFKKQLNVIGMAYVNLVRKFAMALGLSSPHRSDSRVSQVEITGKRTCPKRLGFEDYEVLPEDKRVGPLNDSPQYTRHNGFRELYNARKSVQGMRQFTSSDPNDFMILTTATEEARDPLGKLLRCALQTLRLRSLLDQRTKNIYWITTEVSAHGFSP